MKKIGFIGVGNMGLPMLLGAIRVFGKENVTFTDIFQKKCEEVEEKTGISHAQDNETLIKQCDIIVLSVKPQFFSQIYEELKKVLHPEQLLLSPAAGISIQDIKNGLGMDVKIVRIMPNTAAMVQEAMTCYCYSDHCFSIEEKHIIETLLSSFGKYMEIDEKLMNAAICANGSSPAYVYVLIEALADGVVKYGIPREKAYTLVAQTVLGAAKMVLETKEHPAELKDNVCSPGGTTISAISALEEYGFRNALLKATDACYEKASAFQKK